MVADLKVIKIPLAPGVFKTKIKLFSVDCEQGTLECEKVKYQFLTYIGQHPDITNIEGKAFTNMTLSFNKTRWEAICEVIIHDESAGKK